MTSPYSRACRQTNFSDGEFVCKVPFFLISFSFSYLLSFLFLTGFFALFVLFSSVSMAKGEGGGPSDYTGRLVVNFRLIICQK